MGQGIDGAMSDTANRARGKAKQSEDKANEAEHSKPLQLLGRFGDICYGVVHIIVAVLAIRLAFGGSGGQSVDQKGAVAAIATEPFGGVILWVIAIGLVAFGIWQLLTAGTGFEWIEKEGRRTRRRIGAGARGVAVLVISASTFRLLVSGPGQSSNGESRTFTARLMSVTGGRLLVGAVGVGIVVAAGVIAYRGLKRKFVQDLDLSRVPPSAARLTRTLGAVGFTAKGVAYAIVGILILVAAITFDPNKAGGLDAALRTLARQPFGVVLLVLVAVGLAAYGGYCFLESRCRRG
jgi:hypothetical protein